MKASRSRSATKHPVQIPAGIRPLRRGEKYLYFSLKQAGDEPDSFGLPINEYFDEITKKPVAVTQVDAELFRTSTNFDDVALVGVGSRLIRRIAPPESRRGAEGVFE